MKVGVCITVASSEDIINKIPKAAAEGFDNCQIISWTPPLWTDENAALLKKTLEDNGIHMKIWINHGNEANRQNFGGWRPLLSR